MIIRPIEKTDESEVYHMWSRYHIDELPYVWARQGISGPVRQATLETRG